MKKIQIKTLVKNLAYYSIATFSLNCFSQSKVLITGGTGYLGSLTTNMLVKKGYNVIVVYRSSNLELKNNNNIEYIKCDYGNTQVLNKIFKNNNIKAVIHLASTTDPRGSINDPLKSYINNVSKTLNLLKSMIKYRVNNIIFASSAQVYGKHYTNKIKENFRKRPVTPYGKTKLMIEQILKDLNKTKKINYIILRYFNPFGSYSSNLSNKFVISKLINCALSYNKFYIFGNQYQTKDGTCIRDYIHIKDIAYSNYLALKHLEKGGASNTFNIGSGEGISLIELTKIIEKTLNKTIDIEFKSTKSIEPDILIANISKAKKILNWAPSPTNIKLQIKKEADTLKNIFESRTYFTFL